MQVSKINSNSTFFRAKKAEKQNVPDKKSKVGEMIHKTKSAITFAYFASVLGIDARSYIKHHSCECELNKPDFSASYVKDELDYEIKPTEYDSDIEIEEGEGNYRIYQDIVKNMRKDDNTSRRLDEVLKSMSQDLNDINNKIAESTHLEKRELAQDQIIVFDIDVAKKRYYSIPDNAQPGYSCKDPLLYQKPREEIVDLYIGYDLLQELNTNSESEMLDCLIKDYSSKITKEDKIFIQECVNKLIPEESKCYGQNSVLHSSELSRMGRIFREAMGLKVR